MATLRITVGLLALATHALAEAAQSPIALERTGNWEINYDEDACHLLARFGEGDEQIIAKFSRYQPGDKLGLSLFGKALKDLPPYVEASIDFGPIVNPGDARGMSGRSGALGGVIFPSLRLDDYRWTSGKAPPPDIRPEDEAAVTSMTVRLPAAPDYRFNLRSMGPPMQALRTCLDDLVRRWGFDPVEQASLQRKPTPQGNPGDWATTADFPPSLLSQRANGLVQFRLDIDAEGKVEKCHIQQSTRPEGFADLTCRLIMARARFRPALDKNGRPIASYFVNQVRWTSNFR